MKRAAPLLVLLLFVASCATMGGAGSTLVSRAVEAAGGADALGGVKTVYEKGTARYWEP